MLDAPNLAVHALSSEGRVVAASIVALEGGLSPEQSEALARGAMRIRGHALAETLVCHSDRPDAGVLSMVRSVRIAVHPDLRRKGVARALVAHVHGAYAPDLFGTLFGATPELLRFRRSVGYELVRVGVSRGARTGEPAAVMVCAVSERARSLVSSLRIELARNLPLQLELLAADGELSVEPALTDALSEGLPAPPPIGDEEVRAQVRSYLSGPRPYESAAFALERFVSAQAARLGALDERSRALIEGRVLGRHPWTQVATDAGYPSVPAAMRALRPAIRALALDAGLS
jgi:tRNA(Met) cytidine acetyltransferase